MNYHCVKMLSLVLVLLVFDDDGRTNACVRRWLFLFGLNCSQNFFYWRHSGYTSKPRPSRHICQWCFFLITATPEGFLVMPIFFLARHTLTLQPSPFFGVPPFLSLWNNNIISPRFWVFPFFSCPKVSGNWGQKPIVCDFFPPSSDRDAFGSSYSTHLTKCDSGKAYVLYYSKPNFVAAGSM